MTEYPLTAVNRKTLAHAFRDAPRVDIAIECVLAGTMGTVFADDARRPTAFQIAFPPFYYFAGDRAGAGGEALVREQKADSLLMPSAPGWREAFRQVHGPRLVPVERYSFSAERLDREALSNLVARSPFRDALTALDSSLAARLAADEEGVVDLSTFASMEDFLENGGGYCLLEEGIVTGVAFSSLAYPQAIEVSVYVEVAYREQGRATALSAALAGTALARGQVPHWDAANLESCRLAEKLGYVPVGRYEADWLVI